ncbi:MAG: Uroporphyrinogen decarboxylase [Planctomycetes bacterium ADurb.Bin126]|nr:MAG: Uroporphyrinogen decarboxylase [Planctomycetes bacterium ADurb.Bin126]HOD81625.1 uroporphyrinogen decarboxylase family protein [Phycisphaerae bacterium]HQL71947.1 uroporphyrinogen decarboxylase family protein [Phycisphaerae bacterium]
MTPKERMYATLRGTPRDRVAVTPIFMAWAAHYVGRTYREFYLDGDVLAEAAMAVTRAFEVDQVSAISDPWREAEGYGMTFDYPDEGVGMPKNHVITSPADAAALPRLEVDACPRMRQRVASVARMAAEMGSTHSILGWVEGPLAEYTDLRGMSETMMDLMDNPEMFHQAADRIVDNAVVFARAQVAAGADMIGVGDAAASLVGPAIYREHVLAWQRKLFEGIHEAGATVKLHICGNIRDIVGLMATTDADVIDVDWMVDLAAARAAVGPGVTLCGNIDPSGVVLQGTSETVAAAARKAIADGGERFIFMPGCEIPPGTSEANIRAFCPCEGSLVMDALKL